MGKVENLDFTVEGLAEPLAEVGVFGGSGFYELLSEPERYRIQTPWGAPSDLVTVGELAGRRVAFLPRHGADHRYPPHRIPYRANLWAMKGLGVACLLGPCAAGSLQPEVKPGEFVVCDQLVDRTWGREHTFFDGPLTTHVSFADPYSEELRQVVIGALKARGIPHHPRGTVVVIQGPRFSTRAESRWFRSMGWEVINMTQYPEAYLARELCLPYANISLITDWDVGLEGEEGIPPVTHEEVIRVFKENNQKLRGLLEEIVRRLPPRREMEGWEATRALDGARF